ncbi:DoxX family membrane protein [Aequorivita sp. SDUM287046]|uniref:DoxX family membrane protein n=1 Tax=Aequorivita aurantiaca TaxID=3053356 RepID=A0ABT8DN72_9FLAO|nr:BT_3928 family protein [Aequorivita aurantiaca]MDN3724610.1 DoxX family membrane protein [Aequorivita aurantiaca]
MKILVVISRILVGVLFIISGLIKLNDPVGFSFKLKDYFAPEVLDLGFLVPYALLLAIFVVIFEVLLGVALLLGYLKKFTLWALLLMIVFFTFLTFYSAYFNKVTDCGCFGDAIKLTPWESFIKDIVLLVLILILFIGQKYILPFFTKGTRSILIFASFVFCLGITYYVLLHLPIIDFRPYKIGANIKDGMTVPEDAPGPIYEYKWKFKINGEEKIITTNGDYPQVDGELISTETEMIQEGYSPPIHDFTMERDGEDYTEQFLNEENLLVIIAYSLGNTEKDGFIPVKEITDRALKNGYNVIGLSASSQEMTEALTEEYKLNFKFYFCDETTLKTIVRSNPGILELDNGTIKQKLHWNDAHKLQLPIVENAKPKLDLSLKQRLDSIAVLDQKYRTLMRTKSLEERKKLGEKMGLSEAEYSGDLAVIQGVLDSVNMVFVEKYFIEKGYPGISVVGEESSLVAWNVLQHNPDKIPVYLPLVKKAAETGEIPKTSAAIMEDRYLMMEGKPQIFGSQGMTYDDARGSMIWPIENPETVNKRRADAGFDETIEAYAKRLFGEDFEYKAVTMEQIKQ